MNIDSIADGKSLSARRSALVVGHPGHELKIFGWLATEKPLVCVLTDGSGRSGISRLSSTQNLLWHAGAKAGPVFGAFSDAEFYKALLEYRIEHFTDVAEQLVQSFIDHEIDLVAGDAA